MATELDVSKSRRFDIAMSRRTRRSTSLVACFQDQYVPPLAKHQHQDAKLKTLIQCQDAELQAFHQCEDAEEQIACLYEGEMLRILRTPLKDESGEEKTLEQYEHEQEKDPWRYQDHEQIKQEQEKKPEQYLKDKTSEYQDEEEITQKEYEYDGENTPEKHQGEEQNAPQQHQEADELTSEQHEEGEEQKAQQESCDTEQKTPEQHQGVENIPVPPCAIDRVPRFSLRELIQEKQLSVREVKITSELGGREENVLVDHKVSGSKGATSGTTLAMVIRRPEGGKKSMGVIRRCVKALNQMIKAKQGNK